MNNNINTNNTNNKKSTKYTKSTKPTKSIKFTKIVDKKLNIINNIHAYLFNTSDNNSLNKNGIYISGSTMLNIVKKDKFECGDADIYIDIKKASYDNVCGLLYNIYNSGFTSKNNLKNMIEEISKSHQIINNLYNENNLNSIRTKKIEYDNSILRYNKSFGFYKYLSDFIRYSIKNNNDVYRFDDENTKNNTSNNIHKTHEYYGLNKYISKLLQFTNKKNNKKIDLIFIKCGIRELILNTFDLDIVKNYYSYGRIYVHNKKAIKDNIATISTEHFYNRILNNLHEFKNFIVRYHKYISRGYTIFIGDTKITFKFLRFMIRIVFIERFVKIHYNIYNINSTISYNNNYIYQIPKIIDEMKYIYDDFSELIADGYSNFILYKFGPRCLNYFYHCTEFEILSKVKIMFIFHTQIHEEIIKEVFNPVNIQKNLIKYGWDMIDSL